MQAHGSVGGWAHSVCTRDALAQALADPSVLNIETDIITSASTGEPVRCRSGSTDLRKEWLEGCVTAVITIKAHTGPSLG